MIVRSALCGLTVLIVIHSLLTASANTPRLRSTNEETDQEFSDADHDHRRLSLKSLMKTNFKVSTDPKTTQAKGYVCARGEVPWDNHDEILAEIPSFISAYHARHKFFAIELDLVKDDIVTNFGGTGLFHTFTIWVVLRKLKPKVIVESGVYRGFTSWMIARATEDYSPLIVRVDPWAVGWNGIYGNPRPDTFVDYRGDNYMDLTRIDWDELFDEHFLSHEDKASTLFILDDQADQLRRLEQLSRMGFKHVLVDENFVPAMGVTFSVKDACDRAGDLRLAFARTNKSGESSPRRCDNARKDCKNMTPTEVENAFNEFESLVDTYWEGPPLTPLARPYSSLMKKLEAGYIDGPSEWTLNHAKLVHQSTKSPLYSNLEEASKSTGLSEMHLSYESGRYTNMAYIKLKRHHHHHEQTESRRRLNEEEEAEEGEGEDHNRPKTKGYVCNKGTIDWDTKVQILSELNSFIEMHHRRQKIFKIDINNQSLNYGSFGMFHSFILWVVLRKTKPSVVIESGVAGGYTSWLISKATEEWNPLIVRIDPKLKGWDGINLNPNASKMVNLRGDEYQDLAEVDWDVLYMTHGLSGADKATTLLILDDHMDQVTRLSQIRQMGFQRVVVQSNFVPGVGDAFSLKDACDATGFVRRNFNSSILKSVPIQPNRCTNYHKTCEKIDPFESQLVALDLDDMIKTYWEGPPLSPIARPYEAVIPFIVDKNKFEGPKVWTDNHDRLVVESTKAPFYDTLQLASTVTGFSEEYLAFESGRYVNIAYVELNPIEQ